MADSAPDQQPLDAQETAEAETSAEPEPGPPAQPAPPPSDDLPAEVVPESKFHG
jgi:hypothetical protein